MFCYLRSVFFKSFFCVCCVPFIFLGCSRSETSSKPNTSEAPDFKSAVFYPAGHADIHLSQINSSKPVLIVFWATWCPSCREELPLLNTLALRYQNKIEFLSINAEEEAKEVRAYIERNHLNFPVILDPEGKLLSTFEVSALPSVLLLAKGGKILYYGYQLPALEKLEASLV